MNLKKYIPIGGILIGFIFLLTSFSSSDDFWGFFGHRRINRLAVFTLPPEMTIFYRKHIEYVTEHAVDPDKRRYAVKGEDIKHYIDIDHWGTAPFENVPRDWTAALMKYTGIYAVLQSGDTLKIEPDNRPNMELDPSYFALRDSAQSKTWLIDRKLYRRFFQQNILPQYRQDIWTISPDSLNTVLDEHFDYKNIYAIDYFSSYGIVPYHLLKMKRWLSKAFREKNGNRILQLSAEIGHYIGDAHVPLHTTENYNGQFTNQNGIHAFWESRLPELFADERYDFFVGKADYIDNTKSYFWDIVLESHQLLDSVLAIEKSLSLSYPSDQQFCFEERLGLTVRTQCRAYATSYHERMSGMVEKRMRDAIHAVGNIWFTAWVDAGQPDLSMIRMTALTKKELQEIKKLEAAYQKRETKGRKHE